MLAFLGIPPLHGHRRLVAAFAIDALGTGIFLPLSVLYFLVTTPLTLTEVGLALSLGSVVRIVSSPLVGALVDRLGAQRVLLIANALQALGFLGYLWSTTVLTVVLATSVAALGNAAFWTAYGPLVTSVSAPGERERWFGFLGALRNLGFALGGVLAGVAAASANPTAYRAVVVVDAASFVAAFLLLLGIRGSRPSATPVRDSRGSWRVVLSDRPYLALIGVNLWVALVVVAMQLVLPVYLLEDVGLPGWVPGAAFTVNTVLLAATQGLVVTRLMGRRRAGALQVSAVLSAAGCLVLLSAVTLEVDTTAAVVAAIGVVVAGVALLTVGELIETPVMSALANEAAPAALRGRYLSAFQQSWNVVSAAGPVVLTGLLAVGPAAVWLFLAATCLAGAAGMRALAPHLSHARVRVGDPRSETPDGGR